MNQRNPRAVLFLTVFMDLVGFGIVLPLLPIYASEWGASALLNGLLLAVYSLMQFIFAPAWGHLSDRIGRRPVILVSLFGSVLGYGLFGLAGLWHSLPLLFVSRVISGVMGANIAVAQAYIADTTAAENRAHGMGLIGAAFGLGFILGPVLASLFAPLGEAGPGFGAAAICALNLLLALRTLPESLDPAHRHAAHAEESRLSLMVRAFKTRGIRGLLWMSFIYSVALAVMESFLPMFGKMRFDWDEVTIAHLFIYIGVLSSFMQGYLVRRLRRFVSEVTMLHWGALAGAVSLGAVAVALNPWLLLAMLALFSFGHGATTPSLLALVSHRAGPQEQGRILGVSQSLASLGRVIGPMLGYGIVHTVQGLLGEGPTPHWVEGMPYALAAALAAVVWLASLRLRQADSLIR